VEVWIDTCGDDKRHLTPLMRAAKQGRLGCLISLIEDHGAGVNVRADRSGYTALLVAAYEGQEDCVRALLARGADPLLTNKWGETAVTATESAPGRGAILALLREAVRAREAAALAAAVGPVGRR
jgi:ankyrin repeat protein